MRAGLGELERWIDDRLRTGLADPALARYETWDELAARLVDAQVGGLANRVRRLAGVVGARPDWHQHVLADLGVMHLLARAGRQLGELPQPLGESVAAALGWQVRQAEVLAGLPHTDHWLVLGRSDAREERIEVRRWWLYGRTTHRWAMLLSFAAHGQALDDSWWVGAALSADLYRYPGVLGLRALAGVRHEEPVPADHRHIVGAAAVGIDEACAQIGAAVAGEPWIERWPVCVRATPARRGNQWVLTDDDGALPLLSARVEGGVAASSIAALLACSGGEPLTVSAEWTPSGLLPVAVHLPDRSIDIGPVHDGLLAQGRVGR